MSSQFRFKQFAVEQSGVAMKVGTDGVLLGAWVAFRGDERRVLDIGTGTGVIALMAAQRSAAGYIAGVDVDEASAQRAAANFAASPWSGRLHACASPIQDFETDEPFDLIISNPPYFVDSLLSPDKRRTAARHTASLPFDELDAAVRRLLSSDGRAALILPTEQMDDFASLTSLRMIRRCDVRSVPDGAVKRVMAEFARSATDAMRREELVIETCERGVFSDEYRRLTKDFYLKF